MEREGDAWTQGQRHRQRARQSEDGRRGSLGRTPQATASSCILMIANLNLRSHSAALSHTRATRTHLRGAGGGNQLTPIVVCNDRRRAVAASSGCIRRSRMTRMALGRRREREEATPVMEGRLGVRKSPTQRLNPLNHHAWQLGQPLGPPSRPFTLAAARTQHTRTTRTHLRAASLRRPGGCGSRRRRRGRRTDTCKLSAQIRCCVLQKEDKKGDRQRESTQMRS